MESGAYQWSKQGEDTYILQRLFRHEEVPVFQVIDFDVLHVRTVLYVDLTGDVDGSAGTTLEVRQLRLE